MQIKLESSVWLRVRLLSPTLKLLFLRKCERCLNLDQFNFSSSIHSDEFRFDKEFTIGWLVHNDKVKAQQERSKFSCDLRFKIFFVLMSSKNFFHVRIRWAKFFLVAGECKKKIREWKYERWFTCWVEVSTKRVMSAKVHTTKSGAVVQNENLIIHWTWPSIVKMTLKRREKSTFKCYFELVRSYICRHFIKIRFLYFFFYYCESLKTARLSQV